MNSIQIAKVCHESIRALCAVNGDNSIKSWEDAEEWQRKATIQGIESSIKNPNAPASASHDAWMKDKLDDGWKFGPVKDGEKKEHPLLIPYEQLPLHDRLKDHLFHAVAIALNKTE